MRCAHQAAVAASRLPHGVGRRAGHRLLRQARQDLLGEAADDKAAVPIRHTVDPNDEAAGGQPAEVVVPLQQHHAGAKPRCRHRRRRAGRAAAHHQHIAFRMHRGFARGLARYPAGGGAGRTPRAGQDLGAEEQPPALLGHGPHLSGP